MMMPLTGDHMKHTVNKIPYFSGFEHCWKYNTKKKKKIQNICRHFNAEILHIIPLIPVVKLLC